MMRADSYRTIAAHASVEIKVKGSRFIAESFPAHCELEAVGRMDQIRRREHAASHHCTAFRIGVDADLFRYNDDGEPSGTAGLPIMRQIEGRELTNVLVVVTRYFGGTKLGTGGLIRAYATAASHVLDASGVREHVISSRVSVSFEYEDTSPAMRVIGLFDANVIESMYSERTVLTIGVPRSQIEDFRNAFADALGGRGIVITDD